MLCSANGGQAGVWNQGSGEGFSQRAVSFQGIGHNLNHVATGRFALTVKQVAIDIGAGDTVYFDEDSKGTWRVCVPILKARPTNEPD